MHQESQYILRNTLDQFNVLSDKEFSDFLEACSYKTYDKKDYLLRSGNYNYSLFFIVSGSVGLFENIDGKELYQNFFLKGEFANELTSLTTQTQSKKNLIALENTSTFILNRQKLLSLYEKSAVYEKLGRKLLEHILVNQTELSNLLQSLKPEERYQYLVKNNPDLINSIPQTYLASYLGMARETLSRIRAKK